MLFVVSGWFRPIDICILGVVSGWFRPIDICILGMILFSYLTDLSYFPLK
jgi:hypothetical protein